MPGEIGQGLDPLVTIVTPSYNQGRFIRATVESVLSQDYPHIEYIVMDGGSTDETASVVQEYAGRLTWISEKDRGQSHAINKGFQRAKGSIVAWINSDDLLLPGAVRRAVEALQAHPEYGAVYGEGYTIDYDGQIKGRFAFTEPFNLWKLVHHTDYILQQSVYFRKSVLDEVGLLDESLHWGMDWDILIRIAKRYPLGYVPEYQGCLREYETAKSFAGGAARFRELAALLRRHGAGKYSPGYIIYGLDTYDKLWCAKIQQWTPRLLQAPSHLLQRYLTIACRAKIDRTMRDAQGLYTDGWAGPVMHYMLPPGNGVVQISGELPDVRPLRGQKVRLFADGVQAAEWRLAPGPFSFSVALPGYTPGTPVTLRLAAVRSMKPPRDPRRLSYRINPPSWKV